MSSRVATKPRMMRLPIEGSFLQKIFAEKPQSGQKDEIEYGEKANALPLYDRLALEQADADGGADDQNRSQKRKKEQREQEFAHAGLRGNRGERGAGDGNAKAAENEYEKQIVELRKDRNVVEGGEKGKHQDLGKYKKEGIRDELREKNREGVADGEAEGAECVVVLLTKETGLQHQRSGEKDSEPEKAGTEFAGLFRGGADGKAEEDEYDENKDDGGSEEFAGTKLGAKFLAEKCGGAGEEVHGGNLGASEGEDRAQGCTGLRVGDDGTSVELDGACGERRNFGFAVQTHDDGTAGTTDLAQSVGEPGDAEGIESGGGLVEKQDGGTVDQRPCDGDSLTHAAGVGAHERGATFVEADFVKEFLGTRFGLGYVLQFCEEDEIFLCGKFVVDHGAVRDVPWTTISGGFG